MKIPVLILSILITVFPLLGYCTSVSAAAADDIKVEIYSKKNKFGLRSSNDIVTQPIFKKIIKLGDSSWVVQYKGKYGLLNSNGEYLIQPKYRVADRMPENRVKFGSNNDFGLYDEFGQVIIPPEYSSIDILCRGMFLTCKNYKYGIMSADGTLILENKFESIYMAQPNLMIVQYKGVQYSIESISEFSLEHDKDESDENFKISHFVVNTGVVSGYSVVTLTDYVLKMLSVLSPAYESTIDELMFSQGAETISILMKFTWLPKFPVVYVKNYYRHLRQPDSSPLAPTRNSLKKQMK